MDRGCQNKEKRDGYQHTIKYLGIFGGAHSFSMLLNMLRTKDNNFTSIYKSNATIADQQIKVVNNGYREVIDSWN